MKKFKLSIELSVVLYGLFVGVVAFFHPDPLRFILVNAIVFLVSSTIGFWLSTVTGGFYEFIARTLTRNQALLEWLLAYAKRNSVGIEHLPGYMNRWYLFNPVDEKTSRRKYNWIPFSIRFHEILRPDTDRHNHDHPWNAVSIILRGWYEEMRPYNVGPFEQSFLRTEGDVVKLRYGEYHRITRTSDTVLTLFIYGKWQGPWGFKVDGQKVHWRDYLKSQDVQQKPNVWRMKPDYDGEPMIGPDAKHDDRDADDTSFSLRG